tara:strand:+ start:205 stop:756 length:552 start_codon:yes stop_codon:yes gene_type:complete
MPKKRKPRKPMSKEQKAAAAERLKKARAVRAEKNPDYGLSNVNECIRNLPEDHWRHPKRVKKWIKTQKDLAKEARAQVRQKIKGSLAQVAIHEGYIKNMQKYLRDGDWVDIFYGEHQQNKVNYCCVVLAYDDEGLAKRNVGTFYPDMGCVYTKEMFNLDRGIVNDRKNKRKRNKGAVARKGRK